MLHLDVKLTSLDIWNANGNKEDEILYNCQRYWIAEAIRYTHRTAVESVFDRDNSMLWPELPSVKRLPCTKRAITHSALSWRMKARLAVHTRLLMRYLQVN